jgi:hypothetical protein
MEKSRGGGDRSVSAEPGITFLDSVGEFAASLINNGHPYSEVKHYALSTLIVLVENLKKQHSTDNNSGSKPDLPSGAKIYPGKDGRKQAV